MSTIDHYIHAATRANTRKAYQASIHHFEVEWGGFLPATADSVAQYLVAHADKLATNTLRLRLSGIAQWHTDQGFPDPTKAPLVRKVFKGIQAKHPTQEKQAKPLQIDELERVDRWLVQQMAAASAQNNRARLLKHRRNRAIILMGFWRGFRGDELSRLRIEHITLVPGEGLSLYLPQTKTDHQGAYFKVPALSRLCPIEAYQQWIETSLLVSGPAFRAVSRWGRLRQTPLHPTSFIHILRELFASAQMESSDTYSSHSLRRGFASWATASGWDLKALMEHVGWKDPRSALKYIEGPDPFARHRIERQLALSSPGDGLF